MPKFDTLSFENAMFRGIDVLILHYEPSIKILALRDADNSRCTLNERDLAQICRMAIVRCWEKQSQSLEIRNFDMLVRWSMKNAIRTAIGREYCIKRGRCRLEFFSELSNPEFDENTTHFENQLYHQKVELGLPEPGKLDDLIEEIKCHIDVPRLQTTFVHIVNNHSYTHLNPNGLNSRLKTKLAKSLEISERQLIDDLFHIHFILMGFRENFRQASL